MQRCWYRTTARTCNGWDIQQSNGQHEDTIQYNETGLENESFTRVAKKIAEKRELLDQSIVTNWILKKISFVLLKSAPLCLRGSRSIRRNVNFVGDNTEVAYEVAQIQDIV